MQPKLKSLILLHLLVLFASLSAVPIRFSDIETLRLNSKDNLFGAITPLRIKHLAGFSQLATSSYTSQGQAAARSKRNFNRVSSGYQEARNFRGTEYLGRISVGGGQSFQVIFDTGSSVIMLNSILCKDHACITKNRYNGAISKTYMPQNKSISIALGCGQVSGVVTRDHFSMADFIVENQDFIEIKNPSKTFFHNTYFDGVIGLGLPGLAPAGTKSFLSNLKDQKRLPITTFNLFFDRVQNLTKSHLSFGEPELKFLENGALNYFPVISDKYWAIRLSSVLIDGKEQGYCLMGCTAILDSGSSLVSAPSAAAYDLIDKLNVDPNCNNLNGHLPTVTFVFGDHKFTLEAKDYVLASHQHGKNQPSTNKSPNKCIPGIQPMNIPRQKDMTWILGDVFMSKYYLSFDLDNRRIGIGQPIKGVPLTEQVKKLKSIKKKSSSPVHQ